LLRCFKEDPLTDEDEEQEQEQEDEDEDADAHLIKTSKESEKGSKNKDDVNRN